tara:strand:- start:91 stop:306 length:216 start_codon:yes stop_codon:yes gene_type:complete
MFADFMSSNPSTQVVAVARVADELLKYNGFPLSTLCRNFDVKEADVIKFIVEKTEYETLLDMQKEVNIGQP